MPAAHGGGRARYFSCLLKPAVITSLLPSEPVETKTLAAWAASGYSVVAVRLKNQSDKPVVLDPRRLQGVLQRHISTPLVRCAGDAGGYHSAVSGFHRAA